MRSTGEVMGVGENFGEAFAKAQISAGTPLPEKGTVFISVNDRHKPEAVEVAQALRANSASSSSPRAAPPPRSQAAGLTCKTVFKVNEGRPNAVDLLKGGTIQLVDLHHHRRATRFSDEKAIRRSAVTYRVPCITTMSGATRRRRSRRLAPARSHPRVEPAGDPRRRANSYRSPIGRVV